MKFLRNQISQSKVNFSFQYPTHCRKRFNFAWTLSKSPFKQDFENKKSNCWVNLVMQILYTTPFKIIVGNSKIEIAVVLNCLFKNISKVSKTLILIVVLKKVTDICNMPMAIKIIKTLMTYWTSCKKNLVEVPSDLFFSALLHKYQKLYSLQQYSVRESFWVFFNIAGVVFSITKK